MDMKGSRIIMAVLDEVTGEYVPLVEFPDYEISAEGQIRTIATKHPITPQLKEKGLEVLLRVGRKKVYSRTIDQLLEATFGDVV